MPETFYQGDILVPVNRRVLINVQGKSIEIKQVIFDRYVTYQIKNKVDKMIATFDFVDDGYFRQRALELKTKDFILAKSEKEYYPTPKEIKKYYPIMDYEDNIISWPPCLRSLKDWKDSEWSMARIMPTTVKLLALKELITQLIKLQIIKAKISFKDFYSYNYQNQEFTIDKNNPSIISTLHELGHFVNFTTVPLGLHSRQEYNLIQEIKNNLKGQNRRIAETFACVWSHMMFKHVWPKSFDKLIYNGHMLVKKETIQ